MSDQAVILFDPAGRARCLYSEIVDLQALGRLKVRRATRIEFDALTQRWQVLPAHGRRVLFSSPSRTRCLAWERANVIP